MPQAAIGVIGGSGLYAMEGLDQVERVELDTPFGAPSDAYVLGGIGAVCYTHLTLPTSDLV